MLKCKDLTEKYANDYIDGSLPLSKRMSIHLHLLICKHCKQFIKQLTLAKNIITKRHTQDDNILFQDEDQLKATAKRLQNTFNRPAK